MEKVADVIVDNNEEKKILQIEAPSWARLRSEEELGKFITRRLAALENVEI